MSRRLSTPPHLSLDELEQRYQRATDPVERRHSPILWLLTTGMPTVEVARVTRYSVTWGREIVRRYRAGPAASGDRRQANPGAAPLLKTTPPEQVRQVLAGPAPDGGGWRCRSGARWMRQTLGRPVREQRGGEGMRRLGFTPQRPRPRATRADPDAQEAFTKGGLPPPSRR